MGVTGRRGDGLPAVLHRREAAAHQRVHVHELREEREKQVRGAADEVEPAPAGGPYELQQPYTLNSQCTDSATGMQTGTGENRLEDC